MEAPEKGENGFNKQSKIYPKPGLNTSPKNKRQKPCGGVCPAAPAGNHTKAVPIGGKAVSGIWAVRGAFRIGYWRF